MRLHHVQVPCPPGGEDAARRFWSDALGLVEVDKPEPLAGRGGVWFRAWSADGVVTAEVHVGVEEPCVTPRRAHPALLVDDVDALDSLAARLAAAGVAVDHRERATFPGYLRWHTRDPHGTRVEVLAAVP